MTLGLLNYHESSVDLDALLHWSLNPGTSEAVIGLPKDVKTHLGDWLEPRIQKHALLLRSLWDEGHAGDMLAIGLVCSLIYLDGQKRSQEIFQARGRLTERFFGGRNIEDSTLSAFGEKCASFVERHLQQQPSGGMSAALTLAEQVLASLDLMPLAVHSNLLPIAFTLRLDQIAKSLKRSINGKSMTATLSALAALQSHHLTKVRKDQVRRAEMAVRSCAWLQTDDPEQGGALSIIQDYIENGGYLDWARSRIWSGDEHESVSQAYKLLTKRVSERRERLNKQFSHHLPAVARGDQLGDGLIPVEVALNEFVAPLSKQQHLLLLVLDGMSQAVYRELSDDLVRHNWVELQRDGIKDPGCLVAALPTITKVSRFSLLAGAIGEGTGADEKRAFTSHDALKFSTKFPPKLFHKSDLQEMGSGALAGSVRVPRPY